MANDLIALKKRIVELANATHPLMDGTMEPIRKIIAENEVVFAVWQDATAENGVDMLIVKGQQKFREIEASGDAAEVRMSAIHCIEREQAFALVDMLGEPDRRH
jgi:hypothetical protein